MIRKIISFQDLMTFAKAEDLLFEDLLLEDFHKLNLPSFTYPHRYQGLPRESLEGLPKHLLLHQHFDDLSILKKQLIDKASLWLYHNVDVKKPHDIAIFTYVIPGGLGDYFAGLFISQLLKANLPQLCVHFMPLVPKKAPPLMQIDSLSTHEIRFASQDSLSLEMFSSEHLLLLKNASLVIQAPTMFPLWDQLKEYFIDHKAPLSSETIGEYGFIHSKHFHPKTSNRSLGLHFLELGIFAHDAPQQHNHDELYVCLNKFYPLTTSKIPHYYFAYLYTKAGHQLYLHMLIKALHKEELDIDLFTPDIGKFLLVIERLEHEQELLALFIRCNIRDIQLVFHGKTCLFPIQPSGKRLSIYHTGALSHDEFLLLLQHALDPVGIRGNLSISEALSLKKPFFYDPIEHNITFHQGLIAIAEKRLTSYPSCIELLKYSGVTTDLFEAGERLAAVARLSETKEGFNKLSSIIEEEHRANELLLCLVKRHLLHKRFPPLKLAEHELKEAYSQGKISFTHLIHKLKNEIDLRIEF